MSQMESSASKIHEKLKVIDDYQTHHRLREATGRRSAEDLNDRVQWWSIGQTCVIFIIGVGQVLHLGQLNKLYLEEHTVLPKHFVSGSGAQVFFHRSAVCNGQHLMKEYSFCRIGYHKTFSVTPSTVGCCSNKF